MSHSVIDDFLFMEKDRARYVYLQYNGDDYRERIEHDTKLEKTRNVHGIRLDKYWDVRRKF